MLGSFLVVAALQILSTKVRFERNLEICIGALALAAGVTAWDLLCWINRTENIVIKRFLCIAFAILWCFQPLRVLHHFRETLNYPLIWQAQLNSLLKPVPTYRIPLTIQLPESAVNGYDQIILIDYGDPFSAEAAVRWKRFFGCAPAFVLKSPWSKHGYPFSTVDVYHGPPRTFVFERPSNSIPAALLKLPSALAGGE